MPQRRTPAQAATRATPHTASGTTCRVTGVPIRRSAGSDSVGRRRRRFGRFGNFDSDHSQIGSDRAPTWRIESVPNRLRFGRISESISATADPDEGRGYGGSNTRRDGPVGMGPSGWARRDGRALAFVATRTRTRDSIAPLSPLRVRRTQDPSPTRMDRPRAQTPPPSPRGHAPTRTRWSKGRDARVTVRRRDSPALRVTDVTGGGCNGPAEGGAAVCGRSAAREGKRRSVLKLTELEDAVKLAVSS